MDRVATLVMRIGDLRRMQVEYEQRGKSSMAAFIETMVADAEAELRAIKDGNDDQAGEE
jgi:hypothetical protein